MPTYGHKRPPHATSPEETGPLMAEQGSTGGAGDGGWRTVPYGGVTERCNTGRALGSEMCPERGWLVSSHSQPGGARGALPGPHLTRWREVLSFLGHVMISFAWFPSLLDCKADTGSGEQDWGMGIVGGIMVELARPKARSSSISGVRGHASVSSCPCGSVFGGAASRGLAWQLCPLAWPSLTLGPVSRVRAGP